MPSRKGIIGHKEYQNGCPYHAAPIHLSRCRIWSGREELERPEDHEETERDDVDRVTCFPKIETRDWERFAAKPPEQDA